MMKNGIRRIEIGNSIPVAEIIHRPSSIIHCLASCLDLISCKNKKSLPAFRRDVAFSQIGF
jgi:hypothetical protein